MVYPTPVNETNGSSVSRVVSLARFYECILSLANVRLRHRYAPGNTPQWCVTARGRFRQSRVVVVESLSLSRACFVSFRYVARTSPQDARPNSSTSNGSVVVDADPPIDARIASNISFFREHTGSSQSALAVGFLPGIVSSVNEAQFSCKARAN